MKEFKVRNTDCVESKPRGDRPICDKCSRTIEEGSLYNDHGSQGIWDEETKSFLKPSGTVKQGRRPMFEPFASKGESAHTPGPWEIHDTDVSLEIHPSNDSGGLVVIADVNGRHEANARLIASAPELLAACKAIYDDPYSRCSCAEKVRAAIVKVEGKQ